MAADDDRSRGVPPCGRAIPVLDTSRTNVLPCVVAPSNRDQRPFNVRYYAAHRAQEIERVRVRQAATLEFLRELRRVPCADCRRNFEPYQMDFDHRDPTKKSFNLTSSRAMLKNRQRLLEEIAKCDIVCANCHAIRTYAQTGRRAEQRRASGALKDTSRRRSQRLRALQIRDFLLGLRQHACVDCSQRLPPYVMEFDHRNPDEKRFLVARSWSRTKAGILDEAAKCDVVCPNCHRERTFHRRQARPGLGPSGMSALLESASDYAA